MAKASPSPRSDERSLRIYRVTLLGSLVNLLLILFKAAAGIIGQSAAMLADAAHSLSDFISDIVILLFQRLSSQPADSTHRYGHGKFETLATVLVGIVLLLVGLGLLWGGATAIWDFMHGILPPRPTLIALAAALFSIASKEWMYRLTMRVAREVGSKVTEANAWHHRSDALSSIGAAFGIGGALWLGGKWVILDAVACVAVSGLIIKVAYGMMRGSIDELLEHSLSDEEEAFIVQTILAEKATCEPHNLRTRHIGPYVAIEVHFRVDGTMSVAEAHAITRRIEHRLREKFGQQAIITTHVEPIALSASV